MWCDRFDADLLNVVPDAAAALGDMANLKLWTYSGETDGTINCPSAWHTDYGLTAFFSTRDRAPAPSSFHSSHRLVECTLLEVARDEWVHHAVVVLNASVVWTPPARTMERLMYDVRGWTVLDDTDREKARGDVLQSLADAAEKARAAVGAFRG